MSKRNYSQNFIIYWSFVTALRHALRKYALYTVYRKIYYNYT